MPTSVMVLEKLPSMPNGKLDRGALPLVQEGVFGGERTQARNDEEQTLLGIWRAVLGREDVGVTENFFEAGGDSIQSLQIIARAREAGWVLTPRQIFDYPTVAEQVVQWTPASATASADDVDDVADAYDADAGDAPTSLPLTPIQQWFFLRYPHGESHWNQSVLLQVAGPLDLAALEQAVDLLRRRHDALRLRFTRDIVIDGDEKHDAETALAKPGTPHASPDPRYTWRQTVLPASIAERDLVWRQHLVGWDALPEAGEAVQRSLDLTHGPIWRVAYFTLADAEPKADTRLLLTAHHLAVDGVSWRILLDELRQAYEQIVAGNTTSNGTDAGAMLGASADAHATHLPNRSWSWRRWTRALSAYAKEPARLAELPWWQTALRETTQGAASLSAPLFHTLSNTAAPQQTVLRRLSPTLTDALLRIPGALTSRSAPSGIRTAPSPTRPAIRVEDCLLGAFASAICAHADRGRLLVEIEGHGREDVVGGADLSRTVGWFTTQYPIVVTHQLAPAAMVASVRDVMARVPARGIHWGLLTQQADAASIAAVRALPQPQVSFNYLGRFDSTLAADTAESPPSRFGFAAESAGRATAPSTQGPDRVLDLNAWISNGRLSVSWGYAPQYLDEARVTSIADAFEAVIAALVDADAAHNLAHQVPGASAYEMAGSGDVSHAASTPLVASPRAPREAEALLTALPSPVRLPAVPNHLRQAALSEPTLSAWVTRADIEHALLSIPAVSPGFSTWSGSTQRRTPLLDIARDAAREADSLPLIPMNALGAPWTVFCLHPGYGMVAEYCSVARALNGIATVVGVQAPALRGCPWDGATLEALAAHYADAIAAWCADADAGAAKAVSFPGGHPRGAGRIGLLGWSFGGRLAAAMLAAPGTISFDFVGIVDTATQLAASGGADTDAPMAAGTGTPSLTDSVRTGAPSLLRAAFEADAMHTRLLHGHLLPSLQSNLFFWRAARNGVAQPTVGEKAGDTSVTSAQTPTAVHQDVPVRRSDWQHVTSGVVVERSVDATHTSIVHHPTFLAQLHETLANIAHEG
ncbi:non-ribosomal peptide synthase protein (TIGR01720 family) [Robbsia andropogonis]